MDSSTAAYTLERIRRLVAAAMALRPASWLPAAVPSADVAETLLHYGEIDAPQDSPYGVVSIARGSATLPPGSATRESATIPPTYAVGIVLYFNATSYLLAVQHAYGVIDDMRYLIRTASEKWPVIRTIDAAEPVRERREDGASTDWVFSFAIGVEGVIGAAVRR